MESVTNASTGEYQLPSFRVPYQSTPAHLDSEWRIVCMRAECWTDTEESKVTLQQESCGLPEEIIQERRTISILCKKPHTETYASHWGFPFRSALFYRTRLLTEINYDLQIHNIYVTCIVVIWAPWLLGFATPYLNQFLLRQSKNLGCL
jgi:hypothetical protein